VGTPRTQIEWGVEARKKQQGGKERENHIKEGRDLPKSDCP